MLKPPVLQIPEFSLVLLIGPSSSGKTTFARRHFRPTEVLSSDAFRSMVANDETDQSASADAFEVLHRVGAIRLRRRLLTVIDATNVQPRARALMMDLARWYDCPAVGIVFNLPESVCQERRLKRPDRNFGPEVIRRQASQLQEALPVLHQEGFWRLYRLSSEDQVDLAKVERVTLLCDRRSDHGPFDIIGDLHGCCDELEQLLEQLGYRWSADLVQKIPAVATVYPRAYRHPAARKAVFVGDLVDRGPRNLDCFGLVRNMVAAGSAYCVPGNHDIRLARKLEGRNVRIQHGLEMTLEELEALSPEIQEPVAQEIVRFFRSLPSHYMLDDERLVVAHAGLKEEFQGRVSRRVRAFALYGDTTGEVDEHGLPIRGDWAASYRGRAYVVYGHTAVREPRWVNRTINIDTGCVFGGQLTALRYPELELASVRAGRAYADPPASW